MPAGIFGRLVFNNAIFNTGTGDFGSVTCDYVFTNFEDSSIGDAPPTGWTARGPSGYQTLEVGNDDPPFKQRVATLSSEDGATVAFSVDAINSFAGRADIDAVIAVYRDASTPHERVTLHVRGQGSGTITAGYEFGIDFTNQRLRIYKRVASVVTNPFADLAISHAAGDWKLYRLRANGSSPTSLKVRTWAPSETEPSAWGLSETDSSSPITAAGWVGIGGYVPSGAGESKVNFFSAAAGGCSAYVPVMNDAFIAWSNLPRQRCVLAELQATGYDSLGSPEAVKTVNVYIANMGFTSKASDTPPNQHYNAWIQKIPTFKREMSVALSGRATSGFGSLIVANPARSLADGGARDDWLRMKWRRDSVILYLGDVTWRKSDFRKIVVGVLGQPTAQQGSIEFTISDILERLNRQLQTDVFGDTDPYPGKLKPMLFGDVLWVEPVPTANPYEYRLNDGPFNRLTFVYDDGVRLGDSVNGTPSLTLLGASVVANTITTTADHGMVEDFRVIFKNPGGGGILPTPLVAGATYWVIASGLTADTFKVSATMGGAEVDLTGGVHGVCEAWRFGWWEDNANGLITLAAPPVGRVMCYDVAQTINYRPGQVIDDIIFDKFGLSLDYKDTESFDELDTVLASEAVGLMQYDPPVSALDLLDLVCKGISGWYGTTLDGRLKVGIVALPSTEAVMSFSARDVKAGSLKLTQRIMPLNKDTLEARVNRRWLLNGPMNLPATDAVRTEINQPFDIVRSEFSGSTSTPLDDYPEVADVRDFGAFDSIFTTVIEDAVIGTDAATRLAALFGKTLGVFTFQVRLRAITVEIGDTIQLEHPRLGWRTWDHYDPVSPDNTADIDGTKAVVIGIDVNLEANDPFPVTLTVFRQIPGYYPEEDLN